MNRSRVTLSRLKPAPAVPVLIRMLHGLEGCDERGAYMT